MCVPYLSSSAGKGTLARMSYKAEDVKHNPSNCFAIYFLDIIDINKFNSFPSLQG